MILSAALCAPQILGGDAFADTKSDSQIQNIKVISRGELLASSSETLTSGVLCGMLTQLSDSPINLVNATHYADQVCQFSAHWSCGPACSSISVV
jgi:hypothetical protein